VLSYSNVKSGEHPPKTSELKQIMEKSKKQTLPDGKFFIQTNLNLWNNTTVFRLKSFNYL
jgi:hypothetical protein